MYKFEELTEKEIKVMCEDFVTSEKKGKRCESFVPYAEELREEIDLKGTSHPTPLIKCLEIVKNAFLVALAERFIASVPAE